MRITKLYEDVHEIDSGLPGQTVAIIGGVHGNEATGIHIVQWILDDCCAGRLPIEHGKLILAIGNPRAVELGVRCVGERDLNRMFSDPILNSDADCYEAERAHILAPILAKVDVAIDIHATNKSSKPFVMCQRLPTAEDYRFICRIDVGKVVTDPKFVFAVEPVTVDEFVVRSGGIGLCYETGHADDISRLDQVYREMLDVLREAGISTSQHVDLEAVEKDLYCLERSFCLGEQGFRWETGMGMFNFQPVAKGAIIGWHGDTPDIAEDDGVIIFPKIKELWQLGKPLGYFARKLG